jgi:hypothetical protein
MIFAIGEVQFSTARPSWRIPKASVDAILVVVRDVIPEQAKQMEFVQYHHVIE